jgi:hypothetical protein
VAEVALKVIKGLSLFVWDDEANRLVGYGLNLYRKGLRKCLH